MHVLGELLWLLSQETRGYEIPWQNRPHRVSHHLLPLAQTRTKQAPPTSTASRKLRVFET